MHGFLPWVSKLQFGIPLNLFVLFVVFVDEFCFFQVYRNNTAALMIAELINMAQTVLR
jgi:hypothetical protein